MHFSQAIANTPACGPSRANILTGRYTHNHGVLVNGTELFIPLEGVIDLEREKERLQKEIQRLEGQHTGTIKKLENQGFIKNAPAEVVEREREKAASFLEQKEKLKEKLTAFQSS